MSLLDSARSDFQSIIRDDSGFSALISMTTPNGLITIEVTGHAMSHYLKFDTDGQAVSSKQSHITINESDLIALNYPVRNNRNKVTLYKHLVSFADSNGVQGDYIITESFPDETLGIITCILNEYKHA